MQEYSKHKIDFILPWVDPSDPYWQKERIKYDKRFNREDGDSETRFRDMNTLKYVLRSIDKYCPWYNKIYLITTGHTPEWLDISHAKIELITHEELFIDKSALPVFNSNAIEMNLVNLERLSEKFIYLNDDMMIWKPLEIERFFQDNKPVDFFYHSWIPRNGMYELFRGIDTWVSSLNNNIRLLNKCIDKSLICKKHLYHESYSAKQKINNFIYQYIYKKIVWINHWHHPQPYHKSTLKEVYKRYQKEMIATSKHKFRSSKDITPYIYRYWHLTQGNFVPYNHNDGYTAQIRSYKSLHKHIKIIESKKNIAFVCFNDQMSYVEKDEFKKVSLKLELYLKNKFSDKACFEYR